MRDPSRIPEVLNHVRRVWERYPDLRFSQLIFNLQEGDENFYNVEDDELVRRIKRLYG